MEPASSSTKPVRGRKAFGSQVRAALLAGFLLVGYIGPGPTCAAPAEDLSAECARLARETEILRSELQLAKDEGFYMVLDPGSRVLRIMLQGVTLTECAMAGAEVGEPRLRRRSPACEWHGRIWTGGRLEPARKHDHFEVVAPPVGSETAEAEPAIPPLPEEAFPSSSRFRVRYEGGLTLEVRPSHAGAELGYREGWLRRWAATLGRFLSTLYPFGRDAVRLRVTLEPEDAAALYRSLPPDTKLIVILPTAHK